MRKVFYLIVFASLSVTATAQSLSPQVFGSQGGIVNTPNGTLSYTVGETGLITTFTANGNTLTQGFQQPNLIMTGLMETADPSSFIVYPCPAVTQTWLGFQLPEPGKISVSLFNIAGQKIRDIWSTNYQGGKTIEQMNVSDFAAGTYFLVLEFTAGKDGKKTELSRKLEIIK
ncbi:MAG: hypothetical protein JWO06_2724 [Bacteroidota bacterium]|nr:hypothetical protein [Bacteroidota bacterium]